MKTERPGDRLLLDTSAIYRFIWLGRLVPLGNSCTLELARYELGNAIWKEHYLKGRISREEAEALLNIVSRVFEAMKIMSIKGLEDKILEVASREGLTFYDASYLCVAIESKEPLVTEDKRLYEKARKYVTTYRVEEALGGDVAGREL